MNRPIYDPTAHRLLQDANQALDESGLTVIRSPHTGQWFVLDPWTWTSHKLEHLDAASRASVDETIRVEQIGDQIDESDWASDWLPRKPVEPSKAAGGIVIDESSRVLLRAPRGAYGGYVWTFPKGRVDRGETWPQAALREVEEETGWKCRIVVRVGTYRGDTTNTRFYLMRPVSKTGSPDKETEDVVWVRAERAVQLLNKTRTPRGRERDLTALRDAFVLHDQQFGTELSARVAWQLAKLIGWPTEDSPIEATSRPTVRVLLPAVLQCP